MTYTIEGKDIEPKGPATPTIGPPRRVKPVAVANPLQLIDKALMSGAAPETLAKLMDLQERWEAGQSRKAFDAAMAQARTELKPILKEQTADRGEKGGTYKYEDMAAVAEMVDPIFGKLGLNYRFTSRVDGSQLYVTCLLSGHGHREEGATLSAGLDTSGSKNNVQALGSTASYLERYTLKLSVGLAAAKDDDAQSAGQRNGGEKPITAEQYQELMDLLERTGKPEDELLRYLHLRPDADMHLLSISQYRKAKGGMLEFLKGMGKEPADGAAQS